MVESLGRHALPGIWKYCVENCSELLLTNEEQVIVSTLGLPLPYSKASWFLPVDRSYKLSGFSIGALVTSLPTVLSPSLCEPSVTVESLSHPHAPVP